jgi:hypothetical protein
LQLLPAKNQPVYFSKDLLLQRFLLLVIDLYARPFCVLMTHTNPSKINLDELCQTLHLKAISIGSIGEEIKIPVLDEEFVDFALERKVSCAVRAFSTGYCACVSRLCECDEIGEKALEGLEIWLSAWVEEVHDGRCVRVVLCVVAHFWWGD